MDEEPREPDRSSVRFARSAAASGDSARTSGLSASTASPGSARSDSTLRIPITSRSARSGIASSEIDAGQRLHVVGVRVDVGHVLGSDCRTARPMIPLSTVIPSGTTA